MTDKPEALRLADALMEPVVLDKHAMQAAAELRRLHEVNQGLMEQNTELDKKLSEWVGLTEEEFDQMLADAGFTQTDLMMIGACVDDIRQIIEAKLKEKNT